MEGNIKNLPKWAQEHITDLNRQRETAILALNDFLDNQKQGPVYWEEALCLADGGPSAKRFYLQTDEVLFILGNNELSVRLKNDALTLRSNSGRLVIRPEVSNSIIITTDKF